MPMTPAKHVFKLLWSTQKSVVGEIVFSLLWGKAWTEIVIVFLNWLHRKTCYVCYKAFTLYVIQNPWGISTGKTYLFQKLMILVLSIWILEEVLFWKHNLVRPRKMIWEFSGYSRGKWRVIFVSKKLRKAQKEDWKGQKDLKQAPLIQFCSAVNSMLSLFSFRSFAMTLHFLE